jgi:hypothetical protein
MSSNDFSTLSLALKPSNYELYFDQSTETDNPTTFQLNPRQGSFQGVKLGGRQINSMLRSSLIEQVDKIQAASNQTTFSLTGMAQEESQRLKDYSNSSILGGGGGGWTQHAQVSELDAIDREIAALKNAMPSFNPPLDVRGRIVLASVGATAVQIAGIIGDGVVESVGEGFSAVCSFTPQNQRACDHVVERISSLALTSAELAGSHWDGSSAQWVYHSTADVMAGHWDEYVASSDRALMQEGLSMPQIDQYNRDLAIIGHGVGTLVIGAVTGTAGTVVVRNVKKSMQLIKAQVAGNVKLPQLMPSMKKAVEAFNLKVISNFRIPKQIKSPLELVEKYRPEFDPYKRQIRVIMERHRKNYDHLIKGEQDLLRSSTLAPRRITPTEGLATDRRHFYSECRDYLIKGSGIGPSLGRINHTLMYQTSEGNMLFYIKKKHYSKILVERDIRTVHNSFKLTAEEQMEFIIERAYSLAQNTPSIKRVSFAWDSDYYPVATTLIKQNHIFEGRGCFALVKPNKYVELVEVKLIKPDLSQ